MYERNPNTETLKSIFSLWIWKDNHSSSLVADIYQAEESRALAYLYFYGAYFYYIYINAW